MVMSAQSAPSEVLRKILTLAIEEAPRLALGKPDKRPSDVSNFSLVHPIWTPIAQELSRTSFTVITVEWRMAEHGKRISKGFDSTVTELQTEDLAHRGESQVSARDDTERDVERSHAFRLS